MLTLGNRLKRGILTAIDPDARTEARIYREHERGKQIRTLERENENERVKRANNIRGDNPSIKAYAGSVLRERGRNAKIEGIKTLNRDVIGEKIGSGLATAGRGLAEGGRRLAADDGHHHSRIDVDEIVFGSERGRHNDSGFDVNHLVNFGSPRAPASSKPRRREVPVYGKGGRIVGYRSVKSKGSSKRRSNNSPDMGSFFHSL